MPLPEKAATARCKISSAAAGLKACCNRIRSTAACKATPGSAMPAVGMAMMTVKSTRTLRLTRSPAPASPPGGAAALLKLRLEASSSPTPACSLSINVKRVRCMRLISAMDNIWAMPPTMSFMNPESIAKDTEVSPAGLRTDNTNSALSARSALASAAVNSLTSPLDAFLAVAGGDNGLRAEVRGRAVVDTSAKPWMHGQNRKMLVCGGGWAAQNSTAGLDVPARHVPPVSLALRSKLGS
mmetsp:Transcript_115319/g.333141  ORF Transcript_115319/g.333141 Transcript_115319/m.333141 type:complete len:240 (+) Transcript_115319:870-1589(+)